MGDHNKNIEIVIKDSNYWHRNIGFEMPPSKNFNIGIWKLEYGNFRIGIPDFLYLLLESKYGI